MTKQRAGICTQLLNQLNKVGILAGSAYYSPDRFAVNFVGIVHFTQAG